MLTQERIESYINSDKKILNLSAIGGITDTDIKLICEILEKNPKITTLDVSAGQISSYHISDNEISVEGAKILAENKTLTTLNIAFSKIGDEGAKALAKNKTLTTLNVSYNEISDGGAEALAENKILITLDVCGNQIGDKGAKALGANTTLTELYASVNCIGDEGAKALVANTTLTTIDVSINQMIGNAGKKALGTKNPIDQANAGREVELKTEVPTLLKLCIFKVASEEQLNTPANLSKLPNECQDAMQETRRVIF